MQYHISVIWHFNRKYCHTFIHYLGGEVIRLAAHPDELSDQLQFKACIVLKNDRNLSVPYIGFFIKPNSVL